MFTRYPGVTSFTDTKIAQELFFGRKEECKKLFYYILSENLTVLYSKSGYGKTSLLQAGVFKLLRENNYYPVYVRFNKIGSSPEEIIRFELLNNKHEDYEVLQKNKGAGLENFFSKFEYGW